MTFNFSNLIPISLFITLSVTSSCDTKIYFPASPYPISEDSFTTTILAEGFAVPYGLAILGDNEYLITDRIGKLFHLKDTLMTEISGMPEVFTFGVKGLPALMHGGLMDLSLHPDYLTNSWIYLADLPEDGFARVVRFKIQSGSAVEFEEIFKTRELAFFGNGMRIEWEDSSHFFLNIGCSNFSNYLDPVLIAQDLEQDSGKIHRLNADGSVPSDNPIFPGYDKPQSIWSYGHRDVQGLYFDSTSQTLFGVEHGPKGGDEFNIIAKGKNYGWPLFSHGINYDGLAVSLISEDSARKFTVLPEHFWTVPTYDGGQAIAPACLLQVQQSTISEWNGKFLLGSLAYGRLMKYDRQTGETFGLAVEGRVRTLKRHPSGDILALVERNDTQLSNGKLIRIRGN